MTAWAAASHFCLIQLLSNAKNKPVVTTISLASLQPGNHFVVQTINLFVFAVHVTRFSILSLSCRCCHQYANMEEG